MSELRLGKSYKSHVGIRLLVTNAQAGFDFKKKSSRQLLENSFEAVRDME